MAKSNLAARGGEEPRGAGRLAGVKGGSAAHGTLELDRLIHERMRLAIVSALAVNESLTFNELKRLLETTDGNLSVHARSSRRPPTSCAPSRSKAGCPARSTA